MCIYPECKAEDTTFQLGIAYFNKKRVEKIIGFVCQKHMRKAIENVMDQCAGSTLWAVVCDKEGNVVYHSYEADQKGFRAAAGWELYLEKSTKKKKIS